MSEIPKQSKLTGVPPELLDLMPPFEVLPWEDASQYEALKMALLEDLKPGTAHELSIVRRLAALDWEYFRGATLCRDVFSSCVRKTALRVLLESGGMFAQLIPEAADIGTAGALVGEDEKARASAIARLEAKGVSLEDVRARAFLDHVREFEMLERRPERNEERRRKLLRDLAALQQSRALQEIEDAEILPNDEV